MEKKSKLNISGTQSNIANSQLLVSTGIPALDFLLGGGAPVGTVILLDEDQYGSYTRVLLRYFLAEGVVHQHGLLVASLACDPQVELINELPNVNEPTVSNELKQKVQRDSMLKIAFRYEGMPTSESELRSEFGNYFDLSTTMDAKKLDKADIRCFSGDSSDNSVGVGLFDNAQYACLLGEITTAILDERYALDDNFKVKKVLRVCLHQIGSLLWNDRDDYGDLKRFLFYLKCLMRKSFGVAFITVPTYISKKLQELFYTRLVHISDIAVRLEVFAGTDNEKNPSLSDYHGFFHLVKLAAINTLVSRHPGSVEYVFKLRRKKFCIEKLHLPPDIQDLNDEKKKSEKPSFGCASGTKHLLEF